MKMLRVDLTFFWAMTVPPRGRNFLSDPKNGCHCPLNPSSRQCETIFGSGQVSISTVSLQHPACQHLGVHVSHRSQGRPDRREAPSQDDDEGRTIQGCCEGCQGALEKRKTPAYGKMIV